MGTIKKPERQQVNELIKRITRADRQLETIIRTNEQFRTDALCAYSALRQKAAKAVLAGIDIEELNKDKSGIRVAALKKAGITNIGQIVDMPAGRLTAINGVGEETAAKIAARVQIIRGEAERCTKVRIEYAPDDSIMTAVVCNISRLMHAAPMAERAGRVYEETHAAILTNVKSAKQSKSSLRWLFSSGKKKAERMDSVIYLEQLCAQGFDGEADRLSKEIFPIRQTWDAKKSWNAFVTNAAPFYAWLEQLTGTAVAEDREINGLPEQLAKEVEAYPVDTSLMKAVLRSYQLFGVKYILHQKRVLLGDEMGLGKTMQAIAGMAHLKAQGKTHFLVVCPVSVKVNWIREVMQHSELHADEIHGTDREEEYERWIIRGGVAVTTYETLTRLDLTDFHAVDMLVVDEAHYVKNPGAQRTKALYAVAQKSEHILFMTGTPLENKVEEMSFLISCLNEDVAKEIRSMTTMSVAPEFREKIAPVYLRRVREDVLTELPEKLEKEQWCRMGPEEENAYKKSLMSESYMKIRQVSWNVNNLEKSAKANRLMEICDAAREDGRKVIVFSFFLDVIKSVQSLLKDRCYGPITGAISANERQAIVDEFSAAEAGSVLVSQIIAGGVGLNIQTASVVILCEPQWKPSTENQAISRVYRMGQSRSVLVHRLLTENSIDEKMMEILKEKSQIFDSFADESAIDEASKQINEKEMMSAIVQQEQERYGLKREEKTERSIAEQVQAEISNEDRKNEEML